MSQDIINKNQDISYTNLDFSSIYTEVVDLAKQLSYRWDPSISDESDPGVVLLKLSSLIADKMNYNIDKSALESFPLSVTQDSSARQLYEQLGYYMNWYESASVLINIAYTGEKFSSTDEETITYTIPKFTIITDSESSRSYAIVGTIDSNGLVVSDIKLPGDGKVVQAVAVEGTPIRYSFLGETTITPEMIDENNRIYLDTQYVAQNAIFIRNSGNNQDNFLEWRRVSNLYEQPYNDLRYKLGIDTSADVAYLEFPDNYAELIGAGIEITYMVIDPDYSDIPAKVLDRFLVSVTPIEDTNTTLSYDNVKIENIYASSGHKNKESIDEAYTNYKRTVGTFKTLITLRDYLNYILTEGEELCSNGFVTDRTNDPQLTYKIMSKLNGLDSLITEVESIDGYENVVISQEDYKPNKYYKFVEKTVDTPAHMELDDSADYDSSKMYFLPKSEDKLTPFSLKFYLLQDAIAVNSKTTFEQTFNMIATEDLPSIDALLEDTSHIQHTYEDILPFGENTYKETEDIKRETTKSYYYYDEDNKRYEFISNSYYLRCDNSVQTPFIPITITEEQFTPNTYYEYNSSTGKYDLVQEWDATLELYTVGVFYQYNVEYDYYYTYEMPDDVDKLNNTNPWLLKLYQLIDLTGVDNINPSQNGWYEIDIEALSPHVAYFRAKYPINMDITTFSVVGREVQSDIKTNVLNALYNKLNSTQLEFGDKIELDYLTEIVLAADSRIKSVVFSNIEYRIEAMYYDKIHGFVGVILPVTISAPTYSDETSVISYNICKDILTKSILSGRTKLLDKDTQFEYHLNQSYLDTVDGIYSIESEAIIDMEKVTSLISEQVYESKNYTLKENETLTLFQPKLSLNTSYENGVHYEYLINDDVKAGDSYRLSQYEYMILYTSITDGNGEITEYRCNVYTNGAIIKPSFDLSAQTQQSYLSKYFTVEIQPDIVNDKEVNFKSAYEYTTSSEYWTNYIQNNSSIINNVILSNDDITIQSMSEVTIEPSDGYRFYWVLNKEQKAKETGKKFYQLFDSYDPNTQKKQNGLINTYTLKTGEALYYIDKDGNNLAVLHAGDTITRNTGVNSKFEPVDEIELYTYIPVIIQNNLLDLGEYGIQFIETEQGEVDPSANGFYEEVYNPVFVEADITEFEEGIIYYTEQDGVYTEVDTDEESYSSEEVYYTKETIKVDGKYELSTDTTVDDSKTYYALVMNSMCGFYENNNNTYTASPSTTYNVFKPLEEMSEDEMIVVDPSSKDYNYFEKVVVEGVEIEDTYAAGTDVVINFDSSAPDESKWSVSGELEESITSRPRYKHASATSILNPNISFGKITEVDVNNVTTYPTDSSITIDSSSAIAYSPTKQGLYEVSEYTKVNITEFEEGIIYYTYDKSTDTYNEVPEGEEFDSSKVYYVGPEFYDFYKYYDADSYTRTYINASDFSNRSSHPYKYYKANRTYQIIPFGSTYESGYTYCACVEKDSNNNPTVYTPLNVTKAQPGIQYYLKDDNDEYVPYSFPVGSDITIAQVYVKGYQILGLRLTAFNYIPVGNFTSSDFSDNVTAIESYLARYNTVTYNEVAGDESYDTYGEYYVKLSQYTPVSTVTPYDIPKSQDWYEREELDEDETYYEFDINTGHYVQAYDFTFKEVHITKFENGVTYYTESSGTYTPVDPEETPFDPEETYYIKTFTDNVNYYTTIDGSTYTSIYYTSNKVYTYKPNSIVKSHAETPFILINTEEVDGGLGCYYKVGLNDLEYLKQTINSKYITINATNNNIPKLLYNVIRNYRVVGKELNTITLTDIDNNWNSGYSIATPSEFKVKDFIKDNGSDPEYYATSITNNLNKIRTAMNDAMSSTHTVFPLYGVINNITDSYVIVDTDLYNTIYLNVPDVTWIPVKPRSGSYEYKNITNEDMRTWYQIIETLVGVANQQYVYLYMLPQFYKFRYLYTTNAGSYYVLKDYVDNNFQEIAPWECDSLTSDFIANNPARALTNMWKPLQENCSITLRENDLYTLSEGDTITLTSKVVSNAITWPVFTNDESILNFTNYDTSYTKSNHEIVYLNNVSIPNAEWRAYSNLLINTSTGKGQQLAPNHRIVFYDEGGDELLSIPDGLTNYDSKDITMFQLENPINNKTGDYIQVFTYDDLGNEVLNSAYIYKQLLSSTNSFYDIAYSSTNDTTITLHNNVGVSNEASLDFVFPRGKYLIPMQGVEDSETEISIVRDITITSGYSKTTDISLDADKIYYTLSSDAHSHISEFETGVDYYETGVSQFDTSAFGLTKDTVPMYNKNYYTLDITQFKFYKGTSGTDWETLDTNVVGVDITTTYGDFDFAAGSKLIVDDILVEPGYSQELHVEYRLRVDNNNYYPIYDVNEGVWGEGETVIFEYDPQIGNFRFSVEVGHPLSDSLFEQDDHITLEGSSESATDFGTGLSVFNEDKTYYILLDNSNGDINSLSISSPGSSAETSLIFGDLFKYENVYDNFIHDEILNKIKAFDKESIFNYTYQPADNELIDNPIQPKSFWDKNHVYNAYTIAQLNTSSTDNINYRFITSK